MIICSECYKKCVENEFVQGEVKVLFEETCEVCCGAEDVCFYLNTGDLVGEKVLEEALRSM